MSKDSPLFDKAFMPGPHEYSPSSWNQRVIFCLIALVGVVVATYMGLFQLGLLSSVWDPIFKKQSEYVLTSSVSHQFSIWLGIPDALLGTMSYLGDIIFALAGCTRRWQYRPWIVIVFAIDVIPVGIVSILLVATQGLVLKAWCFLCLISALISLILIVLAYKEIAASLLYLRAVWKDSKNHRILWNTFFGFPSKVADEVASKFIHEKMRK